MTVSCTNNLVGLPSTVQLVLASEAQKHVAVLADDLGALDGCPVYFVDDGKTGTSDTFIMEAKGLLWEDKTIQGTTLEVLLKCCFSNSANFRIWLADDNPCAHFENADPVQDYDSTIKALERGGAYWHGNDTIEKDAGNSEARPSCEW